MKRFLAIALILVAAGCGKTEAKTYSVPDLLDMLKSKDPKARYTAVSNLGKYGPKAREAVPSLAGALKDPDTTVRIGAAYALAKMGPDADAAAPALKKALKDRDRKVRVGASYALKQIQGKR